MSYEFQIHVVTILCFKLFAYSIEIEYLRSKTNTVADVYNHLSALYLHHLDAEGVSNWKVAFNIVYFAMKDFDAALCWI